MDNYITVKDFGAIGDGETDDSAAMWPQSPGANFSSVPMASHSLPGVPAGIKTTA